MIVYALIVNIIFICHVIADGGQRLFTGTSDIINNYVHTLIQSHTLRGNKVCESNYIKPFSQMIKKQNYLRKRQYAGNK
jgi:hypothetical protein